MPTHPPHEIAFADVVEAIHILELFNHCIPEGEPRMAVPALQTIADRSVAAIEHDWVRYAPEAVGQENTRIASRIGLCTRR
jgi:hypothetical protein